MMDALDRIIHEKRQEVSALQGRILALETELAALELAASLRPAFAPQAQRQKAAGKSKTGGGRRPGDISHDWRAILADMHSSARSAGYDDISAFAEKRGNAITLSSVRDRVRNLVRTGLLSGDATSGFTVTQEAVERFEFTKEIEPPEGGSIGEDDTSPRSF